MAITESQFTNVKRTPLGPGAWLFEATFSGPPAYDNNGGAGLTGEILTEAVFRNAIGLTRIRTLHCNPLSGNANTNASEVIFNHTPVAGVSLGRFHVYRATGAAQSDTAVEVTDAANYGGFTTRIWGIGS